MQTHRTQLASGNPSGRAEWNFRCCFALELPNVYDDIKVETLLCHFSSLLSVMGSAKHSILWQWLMNTPKEVPDCTSTSVRMHLHSKSAMPVFWDTYPVAQFFKSQLSMCPSRCSMLPTAYDFIQVFDDSITLGDVLQVTIGDATKTLASRIWDTWIPFGSESETEVTTVASCRIPLADILAAGDLRFLA